MVHPIFQYTPLVEKDAIRLLVIESGEYDNPIRCNLIKTRLSEAQPYYALSYAWREAIPDDIKRQLFKDPHRRLDWNSLIILQPSIRLAKLKSRINATCHAANLEECSGYIPTGMNLRLALRSLRLPRRTRTIWIDAVCIDQDNLEEKSSQVSFMRDIYAHAQQLLIWLGEWPDMAAVAFPVISKFAQFEECTGPANRENVQSVEFTEEAGIPLPSSPKYIALQFILSREWFKRFWIIRELLVATQVRDPLVHCGPQVCGWASVGLAAAWVSWSGYSRQISQSGNQTYFGSEASAVHISRFNFAKAPPEDPDYRLSSLLRDFCQSKASWPRDRIFALLGLANDVRSASGILLVTVDYKKPLKDLLTELTLALISRHKSLAPLAWGGVYLPTIGDLPSWVPEWTSIRDASFPVGQEGQALFNTTGVEEARFTLSQDRARLRVHGLVVDKIKYVSTGHDKWGTSGVDDVVRGFWEALVLNGHVANEEHFDVFWRSLVADRDLVYAAESGHLACYAAAWRDRLSASSRVPWPRVLQAHQDCGSRDPEVFSQQIPLRSKWRAFVITEAEDIALASKPVEVGDHVVLLRGGDAPFVLRPIGDLRSGFIKYYVVGDTFMYKIMHGEALKQFRDQGLEVPWQEIDLVLKRARPRSETITLSEICFPYLSKGQPHPEAGYRGPVQAGAVHVSAAVFSI